MALAVGTAGFMCACSDVGGEDAAAEHATSPRNSATPRIAFVSDGRDRPLRCTIVGTEGDDVLSGSAGADVICGQGGDDTISGGPGDDVLSGGAGDDTVAFVAAPHAVEVRLERAVSGDGHDVLSGFENVIGSPKNDKPFGSFGPNILRGGPGADLLDARDRDPYDVVDGGQGTDLCIADPADLRRGCSHPRIRSHSRAVPILMYHVIGNLAPATRFKQLWVSPKVLALQMRYLDRRGYKVVSLQEVYDYWHGGPLPRGRLLSPSTTVSRATSRRRFRSLPPTAGREPSTSRSAITASAVGDCTREPSWRSFAPAGKSTVTPAPMPICLVSARHSSRARLQVRANPPQDISCPGQLLRVSVRRLRQHRDRGRSAGRLRGSHDDRGRPRPAG